MNQRDTVTGHKYSDTIFPALRQHHIPILLPMLLSSPTAAIHSIAVSSPLPSNHLFRSLHPLLRDLTLNIDICKTNFHCTLHKHEHFHIPLQVNEH